MRNVIDLTRNYLRFHPVRHEMLGLGIDHPVFFGNQESGRLCSPARLRQRLLDAGIPCGGPPR
jgi:hypothetical protein